MSRRPGQFAHANSLDEPIINLTPLIDVVFVILIMFIVIAPLLELDQIQLADAPTERGVKTATVQESGPIVIHVRKDNAILLNQRQVSISQLKQALAEEKKRHPKAQPQLFQDKDASFGTYQTVKNAAESAGFEQLDIILKPA